MKKALIVATVGGFLGFEKNDILLLQEQGYEVHCACNFTSKSRNMGNVQYKKHQVDFSRSPFSKNTVLAYNQLKNLLKEEKFDLIHCHTPVGGILARLAARKYRKKGELKVIYTAHGFHFFKGAPLKNWILYYPVEWICSWLTDVLITINKEDYERAKRSFFARQVMYIPGVGIDIKKIQQVKTNREGLRKELNIPQDAIVLTSVGELNANKNHEIIIRALNKINDSNLYYILCGLGPKENYYKRLVDELGLSNNVKVLGYRNDVIEIYKSSDVCVFPSKREGLGLAALEGMASGLPLITSNVHGINDYLINGETGYSFSPCDIDGFVEGIRCLANNQGLRNEMGSRNLVFVTKFDISVVTKIMKEIYASM